MARLITLILIGVLMAGNASSKDIAKALAGSQEAADPASMAQKKAYAKEKLKQGYAQEVFDLPPLTPEQIARYKADDARKAEDAWQAGLRKERRRLETPLGTTD